MKDGFFTLVTGASRGIGRSIAVEMARRGHNLILNSLPGEDLESFASDLRQRHSVDVRISETDLTGLDGPDSLYEEIKKTGLRVNILVNNAGIGIEGPAESYTRQDVDRIIMLNIRAMTLLTILFIPVLKKTDSYLVNLISMGAFMATPYKSVYLASKSYILYLTRALDAELKGTGIKTCLIAPSGVKTNNKSIERVERAGWLARRTALDPDQVARESIEAMFRGKKIIIPGRMTRMIFNFSKFIPEGIILAATRKMFRREVSL